MYSAPAGWNALYMSLFSVGPFGLQCLFKALCFLVIRLLIYYWKWSTEIYYYCVAAYFSIHNCQCLLRMFGRSDAGCIYIYPCYTFLVKWPFYYYIMSLSPVTVFDLKTISYKYGHPSSLLVTICMKYLFAILSLSACVYP